MDNLEIKELQKSFLDHHKQWWKQHEENIKNFKENNPNEPLPEDLQDSFSLPFALAEMCQELLSLRSRIDELSRNSR